MNRKERSNVEEIFRVRVSLVNVELRCKNVTSKTIIITNSDVSDDNDTLLTLGDEDDVTVIGANISGADNIPILGIPQNMDIDFFNYQPGVSRFSTASTLGLCLTLLRGTPSYEEFESLITQALNEGSHDAASFKC
ncbi:hypothetical protein ACROYT_G015088 [Oculina patagonica]